MQETLRNIDPRYDRFIFVNSGDCNGTPYNFNVCLGLTQYSQDSAIRITPKLNSITNTFYNITSTTNKMAFWLNNGALRLTVTVRPGHYTLSALNDAFNANIAEQGHPTVIVTWAGSAITGQITSTCSGTIHQYWDLGMGPRLGIYDHTMSSATVVFEGQAQLNYPTVCVIRGDFGSAYALTSQQYLGDIIDVLPLDVPYGTVISRSYNDVDLHSITFQDTRNLSCFRLRLTDEDNNLLEGPNNNYSVHLFKLFVK